MQGLNKFFVFFLWIGSLIFHYAQDISPLNSTIDSVTSDFSDVFNEDYSDYYNFINGQYAYLKDEGGVLKQKTYSIEPYTTFYFTLKHINTGVSLEFNGINGTRFYALASKRNYPIVDDYYQTILDADRYDNSGISNRQNYQYLTFFPEDFSSNEWKLILYNYEAFTIGISVEFNENGSGCPRSCCGNGECNGFGFCNCYKNYFDRDCCTSLSEMQVGSEFNFDLNFMSDSTYTYFMAGYYESTDTTDTSGSDNYRTSFDLGKYLDNEYTLLKLILSSNSYGIQIDILPDNRYDSYFPNHAYNDIEFSSLSNLENEIDLNDLTLQYDKSTPVIIRIISRSYDRVQGSITLSADQKSNSTGLIIIIAVILGGCCLFCVIFAVIVICLVVRHKSFKHRNNSISHNSTSYPMVGQQASLTKMHGGLGQDCTICLKKFILMEDVTQISSCGHIYHLSCFTNWWQQNMNCPQCQSQQFKTLPNQNMAPNLNNNPMTQPHHPSENNEFTGFLQEVQKIKNNQQHNGSGPGTNYQ